MCCKPISCFVNLVVALSMTVIFTSTNVFFWFTGFLPGILQVIPYALAFCLLALLIDVVLVAAGPDQFRKKNCVLLTILLIVGSAAYIPCALLIFAQVHTILPRLLLAIATTSSFWLAFFSFFGILLSSLPTRR